MQVSKDGGRSWMDMPVLREEFIPQDHAEALHVRDMAIYHRQEAWRVEKGQEETKAAPASGPNPWANYHLEMGQRCAVSYAAFLAQKVQ